MPTSEAVPFAKTGGLADVCGALPIELARQGHETAVILPAYRQTRYCGLPIEPLGIEFIVPIGSRTVPGRLLRSRFPDSNVPVYLVQQDDYYDREELYRQDGEDYPDNCERFVFFSRAVLESVRLLELTPDVIHVHDWQTGLVPAYLKIEYSSLPRYHRIATLLTIHNIAYQGNFWHWDMLLTGLDWKYFNWRQMEFYGHLNLLKTGIVFADSINTVSPKYAEEIQTPEFGCGLEGVLQHRRNVLSGILNGIDDRAWNPAADPHIAANYSAENARQGKSICKAALQDELRLPRQPDTPLIASVGRFDDQKGFDLIGKVISEWVGEREAQWVVLGKGEPKYHELFAELARRFPNKVAVRIEFSDPLAHRIEAGADIFLMPSRYEPCGLNQMYSLRYGTVPVVRETGGLADTIVDTTDATLSSGTANGFSFQADTAAALSDALQRAVDAYRQKDLWSRLIATGMAQDRSWARRAKQYEALYERTIALARPIAT